MDCDSIMRGFNSRRSPHFSFQLTHRHCIWKGDRVAEGVTLEMLCTTYLYRGFESLSFRRGCGGMVDATDLNSVGFNRP